MWKGPAWSRVLRDLVFLAIGGFGILFQQVTGNINLTLLGLYILILGVPTGAAMRLLSNTPAPMDTQSSLPPQESSSPSAPST